MPGNNLIFKLLTFQYNSGTRSCKEKNNNRTPVLTAYLLQRTTRALYINHGRSSRWSERKRERVSPAVSRHIATLENEINQMERKREEKYIYIEWEKKIFSITISIMRHHQPGVIISWTFISRQDNKCPVAQLFLTNLAIVFHPPSEHRVFPRFRDFFLFFSLFFT